MSNEQQKLNDQAETITQGLTTWRKQQSNV